MDEINIVDRPEYQDLVQAPSRSTLVVAIGFLAAVTLYCTGTALQKSYGPSLLCAPFFVGAIVGLFSGKHPVKNTIVTVVLALALSVVAYHEGIVCCIMALPVVMPTAILGALCTSTIRRFVRGERARAIIGSLLMLVAVIWQAIEGAADQPAHHPLHRAQSAVVIAASPARVFAALTARDLQVRSDWPWFLRIGLPMPSRLQLDQPGPDGRITATFSQGVAHGHVTEWRPGRALAYAIDRYQITDLPFHITRLGRAPSYGFRAEQVDDWLTIVSTRYQLVPLPSGETRLHREIVWRRHLAPAWYFAWLQQTVVQRGQDRLLALIREGIADNAGPGPAAPLVADLAAPLR